MTAIFPKYHELICNTYTPDFTASGTQCTLQSAELVTRSRLVAGGTFFRSVRDGGTGNVNSITLECTITPNVGSPTNVEDVVFKITDVGGTIQTIQFTQDSGSPCIIGDDGVKKLRGILNAGSPVYPYAVSMPEVDDVQPWDASTQDAHCTLTAFGPVSMGGAEVLPDATAAIRTGPAFSLFHVIDAETGSKGEITTVDAISEWDGTQWIAYPSTLYDPDSPPPCP